MSEWADKRGIATEKNINRFIELVGGERVDRRFPNAHLQNADYIFDEKKILIELKILETEFGSSQSIQQKESDILEEMARNFSAGEIIRMENNVRVFYAQKKLALFKVPLSRIAKKANKQLRETKKLIGNENFRGVLWLVNNNFTSLGVRTVLLAMCQILNGSNSQIRALVYVTNHYVDVPGNNYANLLWVPVYADHSADDLPDFIDWLGSLWGDFIDTEMGGLEYRYKGEDVDVINTRPIT